MSCNCQKDCHCQQNGSFVFGLIIGLVIAAVVAIVIYKNNRQDVIIKLKKQLEKFFSSLKKSETFENISTLAKKVNINNSAKISQKPKIKIHKIIHKKKAVSVAKIDVVLPPKLIKKELDKKILSPKSKPRVFKK